MKAIHYKILLLSVIASQQLAYILCHFGHKGFWYQFNATSHILLWATLFIGIHRQNSDVRRDKWAERITWYGAMLAFNQFIDEFFLNPEKLQWNEVMFASLIVIHLLSTIYARKRKS